MTPTKNKKQNLKTLAIISERIRINIIHGDYTHEEDKTYIDDIIFDYDFYIKNEKDAKTLEDYIKTLTRSLR